MRIGAASTQVSHDEAATGALPSPVNASVAHLNVNGTAMVASLAASSSSIENATRHLRSLRSTGQMYGHSPRMIANSEPPRSANTSRFKDCVVRGGESIDKPALTARAFDAAIGGTKDVCNLCHIEILATAKAQP